MAQEMSFAQALTEARQIIVQQSSRIKSDLDKIKALQETIAAQTATISSSDRTIREQSEELSRHDEQIRTLNASLKEANVAREQAEAIIDRQGQRLTQSQTTIASLEAQIAEHSDQIAELTSEIQSVRQQLPTQEDSEALAALSTLLSTKKVSVPAAGKASPMRIARAGRVSADAKSFKNHAWHGLSRSCLFFYSLIRIEYLRVNAFFSCSRD